MLQVGSVRYLQRLADHIPNFTFTSTNSTAPFSLLLRLLSAGREPFRANGELLTWSKCLAAASLFAS